MIEFPNAKINLGLRVLRKRDDGFHDLETVFFPVPLCDILEIIEDEGSNSDLKGSPSDLSKVIVKSLPSGRKVSFSASGIPVDGAISNNLCLKACELFDTQIGISSDLKLHLHKAIPMGAGLGGGSSDAAFVLKMLNKLTGQKATEEELLSLATQLGSDCAFFIRNASAFAENRGETLTHFTVNLSGYVLVIVKPPVHVATKDAFAGIVPTDTGGAIRKAINLPIEEWQNELINDFELSVFKKYPEIARIKEELQKAGAVYVSMSGSGSAIFGIFKENAPLKNQFPGCFYFETTLK